MHIVLNGFPIGWVMPNLLPRAAIIVAKPRGWDGPWPIFYQEQQYQLRSREVGIISSVGFLHTSKELGISPDYSSGIVIWTDGVSCQAVWIITRQWTRNPCRIRSWRNRALWTPLLQKTSPLQEVRRCVGRFAIAIYCVHICMCETNLEGLVSWWIHPFKVAINRYCCDTVSWFSHNLLDFLAPETRCSPSKIMDEGGLNPCVMHASVLTRYFMTGISWIQANKFAWNARIRYNATFYVRCIINASGILPRVMHASVINWCFMTGILWIPAK